MNSAWIVIQDTLQNDVQGHITNMIKVTRLLVLQFETNEQNFFFNLLHWIALPSITHHTTQNKVGCTLVRFNSWIKGLIDLHQ
jgi:hypothetical protein